jgi:hypothetical protein
VVGFAKTTRKSLGTRTLAARVEMASHASAMIQFTPKCEPLSLRKMSLGISPGDRS